MTALRNALIVLAVGFIGYTLGAYALLAYAAKLMGDAEK